VTKSFILLGLVLALSNCTTTQSISLNTPQVTHVDLPDGVTIRIENNISENLVASVLRQDLPRLLEQTGHWGALSEDVIIRIHGSSSGFRDHVKQDHPGHLDGWATYRSIDVQSPRAAGVERWRDRLRQVVVHELTHVRFFQTVRLHVDWRQTDIPFWFVEGMAVYTAQTEQSRTDWRGLRRASNGLDLRLLLDPTPIVVQQQSRLAYTTAGVAFGEILALKGTKGIREIMGGLSNGETFTEVFRRVYDRSIGDILRSWGAQIGQDF